MQMDGAADQRSAQAQAQQANAEVGEAIVASKAAAVSGQPSTKVEEEDKSDQSEAGEDMDVDPEDSGAAAALPPPQTSTPPKSPPPAEAEAPGATEDVEMGESVAREREKGLMERSVADAIGEATTEMEGGGHNIGRGPAV